MFQILYHYILIGIFVSRCFSGSPFHSEQPMEAIEEPMSPLSELFSYFFEIEYSEEDDSNSDLDLSDLYLTIGLESGKKPAPTTTTTTEEPTTVTKKRTTKRYRGK